MTKLRPILTDLLIASITPIAVSMAVFGLLYGNQYLMWSGIIGLSVLCGVTIVFTCFLGVTIPLETVRRWREYSVREKWFYGTIFIVVVLGVFAVCGATAWLVFTE